MILEQYIFRCSFRANFKRITYHTTKLFFFRGVTFEIWLCMACYADPCTSVHHLEKNQLKSVENKKSKFMNYELFISLLFFIITKTYAKLYGRFNAIFINSSVLMAHRSLLTRSGRVGSGRIQCTHWLPIYIIRYSRMLNIEMKNKQISNKNKMKQTISRIYLYTCEIRVCMHIAHTYI